MKYNPTICTAYFETVGIPTPVYEYKFHPTRKWPFDIAWPEYKLAIEVNGAIFKQGKHSRGAGILKDWEKWNEATAMGWRVLFCQPKDLLMNEMTSLIMRCIGNEKIGTITDGYGTFWSKTCPRCGKATMQVMRPGKVKCAECGWCG